MHPFRSNRQRLTQVPQLLPKIATLLTQPVTHPLNTDLILANFQLCQSV